MVNEIIVPIYVQCPIYFIFTLERVAKGDLNSCQLPDANVRQKRKVGSIPVNLLIHDDEDYSYEDGSSGDGDDDEYYYVEEEHDTKSGMFFLVLNDKY